MSKLSVSGDSDARIPLEIYGQVVGEAQRRAVENQAEQIKKYAVH
jgi:hypothetical protein